MVVQILALTVLGLMCGSELNVAIIAHPILNHQPLQVHITMRASFATLLGRIMPFWMGGSTLLTLLLLLPFERLSRPAWHLTAFASALQVLAVVFSLVGPVPINNRVAKWTVATLPENWRAMEQRWDLFHNVRTFALIVAFVLLALSLRAQ